MLIRDEDINLRLPSAENTFVAGLPTEASFFSPATFRSSASAMGSISSETAFMGILSLLGKATSYLQTGGVKGDTHFPWHANSKLASLRGELAIWYQSVARHYHTPGSFENLQNGTDLLAVQIYHLIHCLLFREFLPVNYQPEGISGSSAANWQAETIEACLSHANEIVVSLQSGRSWEMTPPFVG